MLSVYSSLYWIASFLLRLYGLFNEKIRKIYRGRRDNLNTIVLFNSQNSHNELIWIHCASSGEWEQAIPLAKQIKKETSYKLMVTFFSPSGFENAKEQSIIDLKLYLPDDLKSSYEKQLKLLNIRSLIFVRYDLWPNLIHWASDRKIQMALIGAEFNNSSIYFKNIRFFKNILSKFQVIFSHTHESDRLVKHNYNINSYISGSMKIGRVIDNKEIDFQDQRIHQWAAQRFILIGGSTWNKEETWIVNWFREKIDKKQINDIGIIIAPHEPSELVISRLMKLFGKKAIKYSEIGEMIADEIVCIVIDKIGILSRLYRYGQVAFIGGGFGKGIHNILEAIVWNLPVITGPNNAMFSEAPILEDLKIYYPMDNYQNFKDTLELIKTEKIPDKEVVNNLSLLMKKHQESAHDIFDKLVFHRICLKN